MNNSSRSGIPPIFRDALDEPVPPEPPETAPERDGDDDAPCDCYRATLLVFGNGRHETSGLGGTLLVAWFWVASAVALWTAWQAFSAVAAATAVLSLLSTIGAVLVLAVAQHGIMWLYGRMRDRKAARP